MDIWWSGGGLAPQLGTWTLASDVASVVHESTASDYPSYYVSADNLVDTPFYARLTVESDASDDMIGLVFSQKHRFYGEYDYGPDTFYALTWKRTTEDKEIAPGYVYTAEEGLKLLRFQNVCRRQCAECSAVVVGRGLHLGQPHVRPQDVAGRRPRMGT